MLKGRTVLVTGSTGGIGEAFARAFAGAGCNVMMNGFGDAAAIEALRAGIAAEHGVEVAHHPADVGRREEVEDLVAQTQKRFGTLDIVVNNAVVRHFSPVESFPVEGWERALAVNLSAAFHTIRLALPGMKARNWGRIINMASIHSTKVVRDRIDYMTTKHAIVGLTKSVALECAATAVTCNALAPGWVLTPNTERTIERTMAERGLSRDAAFEQLMAVRQPSRRAILPAEVAALGVFLCSDAAANISGASVPIDGAWSTC